MPRKLTVIDTDLRNAVNRRIAGRERIAVLSDCITSDTRLIDRLLAERAEALHHSGVPSGR